MRHVRRFKEKTHIDLNEKFTYFNDLFFDEKLPEIPVSFEKTRDGVAGVYSMEKRAIKISDGYLKDENEAMVDSILIHEMVHYWVDINGLHTSGKYHNKAFMDKVKEINRASNNRYKVGLTDVSVAIGMDDSVQKKEIYLLLGLRGKMIAPNGLAAPIQFFSALDKRATEEIMEKANILGKADVKFLYMVKAAINNNFLTEKLLEGKLDSYNEGFHGWANDFDKYVVKMMKQSNEYSIVGRYNWRDKRFEKAGIL